MHHFVLGGILAHRQGQFVRDHEQDIFRRYTRICDINDFDRVRQLQLQHAAQHGFATTDFAHDLDDTLTALNRVNQRAENVAALATLVKQAGIGGYLEGRAIEAEIIFVHGLFPALEPIHAAVQSRAIDAEHFGRLADVALMFAHRQINSFFLDHFQQPIELEIGILQCFVEPAFAGCRAVSSL